MPSRNVVKIDVPESYYHVYARGASRQDIFLDQRDYAVFLSLLKRYLNDEPAKDSMGREYKNFYKELELLAFCLMPNHFHLLIYQNDEGAVPDLMRGVMTSYSVYFNKKYKRSGRLTESRYKASRISSDEYLMHISRYIHLNPAKWRDWKWSSLSDYIDHPRGQWIRPQRILELFAEGSYEEFAQDYEASKQSFKSIKHELANS